jgi:hypothetical protein
MHKNTPNGVFRLIARLTSKIKISSFPKKAHLYRSVQIFILLGRVLIKDIALEPFVFCHLPPLRHGAKYMKLNKEAKAFEMRMLENEILNLIGERREEAMKAYRKLLSSTSDETMYLMRS